MQASDKPVYRSTCLVCYESRPLKTVGNCKHSFCTECLSSVLESLDSGTEVFACPSCKVDCPRPWDGVNGLVDFTGEDVNAQPLVLQQPELHQESTMQKKSLGSKGPTITKDVKCQICLRRKRDVQAVSLCVKCGHFYFCKDCTELHARNKATRDHLVTSLTPDENKDVAMCEMHDADLTSYCQTCGNSVCTVCVMLDHGDHTIEDLKDTIASKVKEVKKIFETQQKKLTELQHLKKDLIVLKAMAPTVNKQDTLIKEIEDHAEKCIDQIVKWKEDLKTQVKKDFKVIEDISIGMEHVSEMVEKIEEPINAAAMLLKEFRHHPEYLEKLMSMQHDLEVITETGIDIEDGELGNKLAKVHMDNHSFVPEIMPTRFGDVEKSKIFEPKEIFQKTFQVDSKDMSVPSVANLGKCFAVAHPATQGKLSNAIDIYKFPGTFIKTLDQLPPIYDMSSTPDGKLAILSNAKGMVGAGCCVKVVDLETGVISSTKDIGTKPLSMGVTCQNQYVILGINEQDKNEVTVVDKDGTAEFVTNLESDKILNPDRITCGRRFIFVKGQREIIIFQMFEKVLKRIECKSLEPYALCTFADISATVWDDIVSVEPRTYTPNFFLHRRQDKENKLEWSITGHLTIPKNKNESKYRVSARHGHVVISHGQTIRVYKL